MEKLPGRYTQPSPLHKNLPPIEMSTFDVWLPRPSLKTQSGPGFGLAACPALGLLVTSGQRDTLSVWREPRGGDGAGTGGHKGLEFMYTLGGEESPLPMQFNFNNVSGYLAFLPPVVSAGCSSTTIASDPLLLVTDNGHDAVHIVDVVRRRHVGYIADPGSVAGPRGVAACNTASSALVAISAWKETDRGDHVVHVFASNGSGSHWTKVRVIGGGFGMPGARTGQLYMPRGLRFSADGSMVCVANCTAYNLSLFRVEDGAFVRHLEAGVLYGPYDVEEVEGGWVVPCHGSHSVEFVGGDGNGTVRSYLGKAGGGPGRGDGEFCYPATIALVPGLGLVVRDDGYSVGGGCLQVFSTPDMIAMLRMSAIRVAWMAAACRAVLRRGLFSR